MFGDVAQYHFHIPQDQMEHLQQLHIVAESINSKMTENERKRVFADLHCMAPNTRLLYITPEQAATKTFQVGYC